MHYSKINKLHTDVLKVGPLVSHLEAEIHCKLHTDNTSQRSDSLKNRRAALHCPRSYSEVVIPCTELLNISPGARGRVRIPSFPSVVETDLDFKDLKPNPLPARLHRLQGVIQATEAHGLAI